MMIVNDMMISTQDVIEERKIIQTLGLVKGNTIRARHIGKDILAGFRGIVGGEIEEYTKVFAEAREQAIDRMVEEAKQLGADAIVCMRLTTSTVMQGAAELLAYGTAVKLENK
jgi:uncharacterized protein YbjQ (UPF0145 family)